MNRAQAIEALATFLTGPSMVIHSVGLEGSTDRRMAATEFFKLRDAFKITGYMKAPEAAIAITRILTTEPS